MHRRPASFQLICDWADEIQTAAKIATVGEFHITLFLISGGKIVKKDDIGENITRVSFGNHELRPG